MLSAQARLRSQHNHKCSNKELQSMSKQVPADAIIINYLDAGGNILNVIGWSPTVEEAVEWMTNKIDRGMYTADQLDITYKESGRWVSWVYEPTSYAKQLDAAFTITL